LLVVVASSLDQQQHVVERVDHALEIHAFAGELFQVLAACPAGDYIPVFFIQFYHDLGADLAVH
jgi:hypothetical protein